MSNRVRMALLDRRVGFYRGNGVLKYLEQAVAERLSYPFSLLHLSKEKVARAKELFNLLRANDHEAKKACTLLITREARHIRHAESAFKMYANDYGPSKPKMYRFAYTTEKKPVAAPNQNPFHKGIFVDGQTRYLYFVVRADRPRELLPPGYRYVPYDKTLLYLEGPGVNSWAVSTTIAEARVWLQTVTNQAATLRNSYHGTPADFLSSVGLDKASTPDID